MLVRWVDDVVRRACTVPELGQSLWGSPGWALVQELLIIVGETTPLTGLVRFAAVEVGLDSVDAVPVVAMRYRSVELFAHPYRADGPVPLNPEESPMACAADADRLLIHDLRCEQLSPTHAGAVA